MYFLSEMRKKYKMTQMELAKRSGLTRQCVSLFEGGQRIPSFFSLCGLAKGFNMSVVRFIFLLMKKFDYFERKDKDSMEKTSSAANKKNAKWKTK